MVGEKPGGACDVLYSCVVWGDMLRRKAILQSPTPFAIGEAFLMVVVLG